MFGCLLSDLQLCDPAEATSPLPTPVHSGDGTAAAAAAAAAAASSSNGCGTSHTNGHSSKEEDAGTAGKEPANGVKGKIVAVKVLRPSQCKANEFVKELEVLARCRHRTIVTLQVGGVPAKGALCKVVGNGNVWQP